MKILWVSNSPLLKISLKEKMIPDNREGWMILLAEAISQNNQLTYIFPNKTKMSGKVDSIYYESFYPSNSNMNKCFRSIERIIAKGEFDVIHIHGTEFPHSYFAVKVSQKLGIVNRCIVSIQGIISRCAEHYCNGLDCSTIYGIYPKDILRGNVKCEQLRFRKRGESEDITFRTVQNVIGRTTWDKTCVKLINPKINYFYNSEILRANFYTSPKWSLEKCNRHTIFMSQAGYPLKGGHFAIKAIEYVKRAYPDVKLYIAGRDMIHVPLYKRSYYQNYLKNLIIKLGLQENVVFLGNLDEEQMIEEYLKANVYISASTVENSPNSVCEAQILGVPVISSMVGGVPSLIEHGKTGYLYQCDAPYMLAHYIEEIFDNDDLEDLSHDEINVAEERHEINTITDNLKKIYEDLQK